MPGATFEWASEKNLVVTASQSWVNSFLKCPERARRELNDDAPRIVTDAMAVGTALHVCPEVVMKGGTIESAYEQAATTFIELSRQEDFRWVQVKREETALRYIENAISSFAMYVLPELEDVVAVEQSITQELGRFQIGDVYVILKLAGTPDIVTVSPLGFHVWDWKTANRPYEQWEVDRFYVQPSAYTFLVSEWLGEEPIDFTYCVFSKAPDVRLPQYVRTLRDAGDWAWLREQIRRIVELWLRTDEGSVGWPLMDQSWHCSPKWCTSWDTCKGAVMASAEPLLTIR